MRLEDQVCSLEPSRRLKELGVRQESLYAWWDDGLRPVLTHTEGYQGYRPEWKNAAFTVAELGGLFVEYGKRFRVELTGGNYYCGDIADKRMADAMAKRLIKLLDPKAVTR